MFQIVCPCRHSTSRRAFIAASACSTDSVSRSTDSVSRSTDSVSRSAYLPVFLGVPSCPCGVPVAASAADPPRPRAYRLTQRDPRAVLPQPFKRVEEPLLLKLHMDNEIHIVE